MRRLFCAILIGFLIGSMVLGFSNYQIIKADINPDSDPSIYILPDGSITPEGVPIQREGNLYTFNGDILTNTLINGTIYNGIIIEKDNIVLDGARHLLDGQDRSLWNNGITLEGRENVTIRNLVIRHFAQLCFYQYNSSNCFIIGNDISASNRYGGNMGISASSNNIISGNNITDSYQYANGITLSASSNNNSIIGNYIQGSSYEAGVAISSSSNNIVRGNTITNNGYGIILSYADNNIISENIISLNDNGEIENPCSINVQDSTGNKIYHNAIIELETLVYSSNSMNFWDNGYPSGGNYWSNYNGVDNNGDGIGDTPYIIDANNKDNYPFMNPDMNFTPSPTPTPTPVPTASPSPTPSPTPIPTSSPTPSPSPTPTPTPTPIPTPTASPTPTPTPTPIPTPTASPTPSPTPTLTPTPTITPQPQRPHQIQLLHLHQPRQIHRFLCHQQSS